MKQDVQSLAFLRRHPVLTWAMAWAIASIGFFRVGDVFSTPMHGSLLGAFGLGVVAWAVAGSISFPFERLSTGFAIWGGAFTFAFLVGGAVAPRFDFGALAALVAWAVAAALGALLSTLVTMGRAQPLVWAVVTVVWAGGFLVGGFVGLVGAMYGGDLVENALELTDSGLFELTVGSGLGGALGGTLAALPGALLRSLLDRMEVTRPA